MAKNYSQSAQKWANAMGSSQTQQNYSAGIDSYAGNPMQKAASPEAEALYIQRVTESVNSGRRSAKLNAVPRELWANNAKSVGAARLRDGATKALPKMQAHFQTWGPRYQQVSDAVKAMPKGTRAASLARVQTAMDMLMNFAGKA